MAHGQNAKPCRGEEWWGKRLIRNIGVPRKTGRKSGYWKWKRLLHKKERQAAKRTTE